MRLKSSKEAELRHRRNIQHLQSLIKKFQDPRTSKEEREKIKKTFQQVIDFVDKVEPTDSMFLKLVGRINKNTNGH
tara:strand:+ start:528 stop:755 length:228 start_codon:yes stop_codon:yes gene_type:complete